MTSRLRRSLAFGIVAATLTGPSLAEDPREGLVVIEAPASGSLAEAGVRPGDVLLSWQRGGASGLLRWPSGLAEAETEQTPWGVVRLAGRRGERPMTWQMPAVRWNLRTRPALSPHLLALYREGAARAADRDLEAAEESWLEAVDVATRADDKPRAAWFLSELGRVRAQASQWEEADRAYESAIDKVEGGGMAAHLLRQWGDTFIRREIWDRAESCYQRALTLAPAGSLTASRDLALLATIATRQGKLDLAERLYAQALSARRRVTVYGPYFTQLAREEIAGFGISNRSVNWEEIQGLRLKLEDLRQKLLKLAGVPPAEGSTKTAAAPPRKPEPTPRETLQKELAKAEREAPGSLVVSDLWQELGELAYAEGDLVAAEIAWLRALDLREKLAPGTLREARTLHDLGLVHARAARDRAAASFFCRAAGALDRTGRLPLASGETWDALGDQPSAYDEDCVNALVDAGRPAEAFLALERSRLRGSVPPLAENLVRRAREIGKDREQALARLARLSTSRDRDEIDLLVDHAEELDAERGAIAGPRDLETLRAALAPGSLLLAWSIGEDRSFLFLLRPAEAPGWSAPGPGLEVFPIRAFAPDLRERVRTFPKGGVAPDRWTAADLYRQLFEPVEEQVAKAETLLLLPGEILAPLPFRSLVRGDSPLAQQKPLETATSATAWAALQKFLQDHKDAKDSKAAKDRP